MSTITITPQLRTAQLRTHQLGTALPARRPAPAGGRARSQVRLTRRGRLVVLVLSLAVVAAVAVWLAAGSAATREDGGAARVEVVTVAPGDTLWDLASDAAAATGGGDVRDMMQRIEELNAIDASVVYAGQELRVPVAD